MPHVPTIIAALFVPVSVSFAQRPAGDHDDLALRMGYHFFSPAASWRATRDADVEQALLFRGAGSTYYADAIDTAPARGGPGAATATLEYTTPLHLERWPDLGGLEAVRGLRGLRLGLSLSYYPGAARRATLYRGPLVYHDSEAPAGTPARTYQSRITYDESTFELVPMVSLYYALEEGFPRGATVRVVPYAGLQVGTAVVVGERAMRLRTDAVTDAATGQSYQVTGDVKETYSSSLNPRLGATLGLRVLLFGDDGLDLRGSFAYQRSRVDLQRTSTWSESVDGYAYTRRLLTPAPSADLAQTGFEVLIGYTVGLP